MRRRGSSAKALIAGLFMALIWGGITAGPSIAEPITYTNLGYSLTDLGTLGGSRSVPEAINKKGQVVGWSRIPGDLANQYHAFLYSDGTMTDLNLGGSYSWATGINEKGQVVGYSDIAGNLAGHAFLYSDGTMTDLTQVVFDLFLVENFYADDIRSGNIIGTGIQDGNYHACILTVPEKYRGQ